MAIRKINRTEHSESDLQENIVPEEIVIKKIAPSIEFQNKERLKRKFPNAVSKLSDEQISELNSQLVTLRYKFGIKDTQLDEHLQAVSDLSFDCNEKKVTLKQQDISIAFDQDGHLGIFVGDTHIDDFIQEYQEYQEKKEKKEKNPLLKPLYDKVNEMKEDLLLGDCPEFSEGVRAASLYID